MRAYLQACLPFHTAPPPNWLPPPCGRGCGLVLFPFCFPRAKVLFFFLISSWFSSVSPNCAGSDIPPASRTLKVQRFFLFSNLRLSGGLFPDPYCTFCSSFTPQRFHGQGSLLSPEFRFFFFFSSCYIFTNVFSGSVSFDSSSLNFFLFPTLGPPPLFFLYRMFELSPHLTNSYFSSIPTTIGFVPGLSFV